VNNNYIKLSNGKEYNCDVDKVYGNYTLEEIVVMYRICVYENEEDFENIAPAIVVDGFCLESLIIEAIREMEEYLNE
jgi:hypothetical protein